MGISGGSQPNKYSSRLQQTFFCVPVLSIIDSATGSRGTLDLCIVFGAMGPHVLDIGLHIIISPNNICVFFILIIIG